jgi:hypothetical protein
MKYTRKQMVAVNEAVDFLIRDEYSFVHADGDICLDDSYPLSTLKTIVKVIEEFDKENGIR